MFSKMKIYTCKLHIYNTDNTNVATLYLSFKPNATRPLRRCYRRLSRLMKPNLVNNTTGAQHEI